ncbi:MAG: CARDB domain-containing protein, partial [Halobacteria archaeon]
VYERYNETNNTGVSSQTLSLTHPDLIVESISTVSETESGSEIAVSWSVLNTGTGITPFDTWTDRVFLSSDSTLSGNDIKLGELVHTGALNPQGTYQAELDVILPDGIEGTFFILIQTDAKGEVIEGIDEGNNITPSSPIAVTLAPYADLYIYNVIAQELLIGDPVDITVSWSVMNRGTGSGRVDTWTDKIVLSRDEIFGNGDDKVIATFQHEGLLPLGESYSENRIIQLPIGLEGRFKLFVKTDANDEVFEYTDTFTNIATPAHPVDIMRIPYADLVVDVVTSDPSGISGQTINIQWVVSNQGIGPTDIAEWVDKIFISSDSTGGTGLREIGSFSHLGILGIGDSYTRTANVTLPSDIGQGNKDYYIFVRTGGPFEFIYTGNNMGRSGPVDITYVPPPREDLDVIFLIAPDSASDGEIIDVSWTVKNNGPDPIEGTWNDAILLIPGGNFNQAITLGVFTNTQGILAGISYTRTETVRLPQNQQGVFQIYVRTDTGNRINETNEDNNEFVEFLTLTLKPRPDLQVTSLQAPQTVTAGNVIDVTWVVTNLGIVSTPTGGSRWTDSVYLSFDHRWDSGDILLGSMPNVSALEPGQSYSSTGTYPLPKAVSGNLFIIVKTDSGGVVDEFPQEDNNAFAVPIAVDIQPVPPPDLVLESLSIPQETFDGETINVFYRVINNGAGVTYPDSWIDTVWLTKAKDRPNPLRGDIILSSFGHSGALDVSQFYENRVSVKIPSNLRGQYFITVWTDAYDSVFEHAFDINLNPDAPNDMEGSNFKAAPLTILLKPCSDLEVTQVLAPAIAFGGEEVTITWNVANNGASTTDRDRWADAIYISKDEIFDSQDIMVFGAPHIGALNPGESYSETATFTLPPSAEGNFFIVRTNVDPSLILTDEEALLKQVEDIISRAEERLGKKLTEVNEEELRELTKKDVLYILTGGGQQRPQVVFEGPFTENNTRASASQIRNLPADLVVIDVSVPQIEFSGERINISWTVKNIGEGPVWEGTRQWIDYIFISPDPQFIADRASLIGTAVHIAQTPLESGQSYTANASVLLPEGIEGRRYIYVFTDIALDRYGKPVFSGLSPGSWPNWPSTFRTRVWEGLKPKTDNGAMAPIEVIYREADLTISSMSIIPQADSGTMVPINWVVTNQGTRETRVGTWFDRVYISLDASLDKYDELIGTVRHDGVLKPGESYKVQTEVRLPDNIEGDFFIIVYTDSPYLPPWSLVETNFFPFPATKGQPHISQGADLVHEYRHEHNNSTSSTIHITALPKPDLRVTNVTGPSHAIVGRPFEISYVVENIGSGPVPERQSQWVDYVFLSRDRYLDVRSDLFLGEINHTGSLGIGQSYEVTRTYNLPRGITGPYYIFILTDVPRRADQRGSVIEANEGNNASPSQIPMLIEIPPPSDLQVDWITVPEKAVSGEEITIEWSVSNKGTEPAIGFWADAVFLSSDGIWDLGDRLIGSYELLGPSGRPISRTLKPGESYIGKLTASLPIALPGNYRVIV